MAQWRGARDALRSRRRRSPAESHRQGAASSGGRGQGRPAADRHQRHFFPSLETFSAIEFDRKTLEHRLRELAFLNSGVVIYFKDMRSTEPFEEILHYEGGVEAFVRHLDKSKSAL